MLLCNEQHVTVLGCTLEKSGKPQCGRRRGEEEEEAILGRRVFLVKSQRWNLAWDVKEL